MTKRIIKLGKQKFDSDVQLFRGWTSKKNNNNNKIK